MNEAEVSLPYKIADNDREDERSILGHLELFYHPQLLVFLPKSSFLVSRNHTKAYGDLF